MADSGSSYVLLDIGCAECRMGWYEPLVESLRFFATLEDAQAAVEALDVTGAWRDHPVGGIVYGHTSGDYWIAPVSVFCGVTNDR